MLILPHKHTNLEQVTARQLCPGCTLSTFKHKKIIQICPGINLIRLGQDNTTFSPVLHTCRFSVPGHAGLFSVCSLLFPQLYHLQILIRQVLQVKGKIKPTQTMFGSGLKSYLKHFNSSLKSSFKM